MNPPAAIIALPMPPAPTAPAATATSGHTCYRTGIGTLDVPVAVGNVRQRVFIVRQLGLVVTVLAGRYKDPTASRLPDRLLLEYIIPAIRKLQAPSREGPGCAP